MYWFTDEHANSIRQAIREGGKIWENECLADFKAKLKTSLREKNGEQCCYCKRNTTGEFNMVLDIEHILPKSKFGKFMFSSFNLNVSCKRCNMKIKGDKIDFIVNARTIEANPKNSSEYYFCHPNLDNYFENIKYHVEIFNNNKLIKYICLTSKGHYTYDFFKLNQLEVKSLNSAQGIDTEDTELSEQIPTDIQQEIESLLKDL